MSKLFKPKKEKSVPDTNSKKDCISADAPDQVDDEQEKHKTESTFVRVLQEVSCMV